MKQEIIVKTKAELEKAINNKVETIIVKGELADKLHKSKQLIKLGGITLGILTTSLVAAPFTEGLSLIAAAPIAALTGIDIALIIIAAFIGIGLIIKLFDCYVEISYEKGKIILRIKQK